MIDSEIISRCARRAGPALDNRHGLRHSAHMGTFIQHLRERRRERRLARQLELRFRERVDAATAAAARLVEDLRRS